MIFACSTAILTDAFPQTERGMALGINAVAAVSGSFIGLIVGGLLSTTDWHLVFLVSVPVGLFGTAWAYLKLRETGSRQAVARRLVGQRALRRRADLSVLVGITYGIQPYQHESMGWGNPAVLTAIIGGIALLVIFVIVETRVAEPMFRVSLQTSRVHLRHRCSAAQLDRQRRPHVHGDHLVTGDLVTAARVQLSRPRSGRPSSCCR